MSKRALPDATDRDLVRALLEDGDEPSFRELYRRHTPRLYQLIMRMVGGVEQDAEDVVQETWVRAAEGAKRFEWKSSFPSWLTGIGINRAKELLRRRNRRPMFDLTEQSEPRAPTAPVGERVDLERALALLPDGYRTVLVLHDVEGTATRKSRNGWHCDGHVQEPALSCAALRARAAGAGRRGW
jgi:RNA polymerase sigma-70 factor (ECF subfamily)